ncbi:hypothetical protein [Rufibacter immobilis]|uniref:hypothetical protein n=1 Tax=Rufibacter immobilis TaxID=1348778 RepID=UPI0035E8FD1C
MFDAAMIIIAQNSFYCFAVDVEKNRIYMKIRGVWNTQSEVPLYMTHLQQALGLVKPGFTILCDIREKELYSMEVQEMQIQAQELTVEAGVSQVAEVHELNQPGSEQAIALAQISKIPLNIFDSLEDAEAWLAETH